MLKVNRSTDYKHFSAEPAPRIKENQHIASLILHIHADYNKRLGAYKITYVPRRDYGINISVGRVYRLMKTLQLPKMSTGKPHASKNYSDNGICRNHLHQNFNQKAPNLVWVSDITHIKAGGKWYYLCIVMDFYYRKVIFWHISANADTMLVITAFRKAYEKRNAPFGLMFHSDRGSLYTAFTFRQLLDSLNVVQSFLKKAILLIMHAANVFSNISRKKKLNANVIIPGGSCSFPYWSTLKVSTILKDLTVHSACLLQMKWRLYTWA